VVLTIAGTH